MSFDFNLTKNFRVNLNLNIVGFSLLARRSAGSDVQMQATMDMWNRAGVSKEIYIVVAKVEVKQS